MAGDDDFMPGRRYFISSRACSVARRLSGRFAAPGVTHRHERRRRRSITTVYRSAARKRRRIFRRRIFDISLETNIFALTCAAGHASSSQAAAADDGADIDLACSAGADIDSSCLPLKSMILKLLSYRRLPPTPRRHARR